MFEGVLFDVYQWEQELYDGSKTTFEKLARNDTVSIFPVLEDGRIVLIEDTQPARQTELRIPMGRIDPGETPGVAALRELREETGLEPQVLVPYYDFEFYEKIDWRIYVFVAKGCKKIAEQNEGPGERIVQSLVTLDEFIEKVSTTDIRRLKEFALMVHEAKVDPTKMDQLKKLFSPD